MKGRKDHKNLPDTIDKKLNLKWRVEGSERLRLWKNFWNFLSF